MKAVSEMEKASKLDWISTFVNDKEKEFVDKATVLLIYKKYTVR